MCLTTIDCDQHDAQVGSLSFLIHPFSLSLYYASYSRRDDIPVSPHAGGQYSLHDWFYFKFRIAMTSCFLQTTLIDKLVGVLHAIKTNYPKHNKVRR